MENTATSNIQNNHSLIFLDIDGTLVDFAGEIPDSSMKAIRKAQQNGHKVFICTGRNRRGIYDFLEDFGFDGFISGTGSNIEYRGEIILKESMSSDVYKKILDSVGEECGLIACCHSKCVLRKRDMIMLAKFLSSSTNTEIDLDNSKFYNSIKPVIVDDDIASYPERYDDIVSVDFIHSKMSVEDLKPVLAPECHVTIAAFSNPNPYCGEVTMGQYDKGTAIKYVCEKLNVPIQKTIAIGDADNDVAMLQTAHIGIAMGNASEKLKNLADYVTDDISEDGLFNALSHFNLI